MARQIAIAILLAGTVAFLSSCGSKDPGQDPAPAGETPQKSQGFTSPREAWEAYRQALSKNDWAAVWDLYSDQMRQHLGEVFAKQKARWESRDKNEKEKYSQVTYGELLKMDTRSILLAMGKGRGEAMMKEDNPADWTFVGEKVEGDWAEVRFRIKSGRERSEEFTKTATGWKMGSVRRLTAARETVAMSNLKTIVTSQAQFQAMNCVDADADGMGEYGLMAELAGQALERVENKSLAENPYLPAAWGKTDERGVVSVKGYCLLIYLPSGKKTATATDGKVVDAALASQQFLAYAWPEKKGKTGTRAFAADATGVIYAMKESPWSGPASPPPWHALSADGEGAAWQTLGVDEKRWEAR